MQNSIDQIDGQIGISSLQKIDEGFDDWVRWLQSIIPAYESSFITRPSEMQADTGIKSTAEKFNAGREWDYEGRWQDDGGESAETV